MEKGVSFASSEWVDLIVKLKEPSLLLRVGEGAFRYDIYLGVGDVGRIDGVIRLDVVGPHDAMQGGELALLGKRDFAKTFDDEVPVREHVDDLNGGLGGDGLTVIYGAAALEEAGGISFQACRGDWSRIG